MYNRLVKVAANLKTTIAFVSTNTVKLTPREIASADIFFGRYFLLTRLKEFVNSNEKPIIGNDLLFVKQGALACLATPPKELGSLAAEKILFRNLVQHVSLSDIPIYFHRNPRISFNLKAARKYNITIAQSVIDRADLVIR